LNKPAPERGHSLVPAQLPYPSGSTDVFWYVVKKWSQSAHVLFIHSALFAIFRLVSVITL